MMVRGGNGAVHALVLRSLSRFGPLERTAMNLDPLNLSLGSASFRGAAAVLVAVFFAAPAHAQIAEPGPTTVRERIIGQLVALTGTPEPAAGDMIGAFYDTDKVCGRFVFTGTTVTRDVNILIYGDLTTTAGTKEGPSRNQRVTFKFYDASANTTFPVTVLSKPGGEVFNYTYQGTDVPPIPIDLPGLDLTPSRDLDFRIGDSGNGGNGGNGGGSTVNRYDIDGDGKVTSTDAALILRQVSGGNVAAPSTRTTTTTSTTSTGTTTGTGTTATTTGTTATTTGTTTATTATTTGASMDVNRDQRIDVNDAIEVLRNKGK
jgi:hypothetical protein